MHMWSLCTVVQVVREIPQGFWDQLNKNNCGIIHMWSSCTIVQVVREIPQGFWDQLNKNNCGIICIYVEFM